MCDRLRVLVPSILSSGKKRLADREAGSGLAAFISILITETASMGAGIQEKSCRRCSGHGEPWGRGEAVHEERESEGRKRKGEKRSA